MEGVEWGELGEVRWASLNITSASPGDCARGCLTDSLPKPGALKPSAKILDLKCAYINMGDS